jgi:hypothetical protein
MGERENSSKNLTVSRPRCGVAWAMAITLLVNIFTITPIMLRMAVADEGMTSLGCPLAGMHGEGTAGHHPIEHSHCLICTGGIGVALLAANFAPVGPTLAATAPARELPVPFPSRGVRTAYISRAPPILA